MITVRNERTFEFRGLSSDTKPINNLISNGSFFIEMDTSKTYVYDAQNKEWKEFSTGGGGGGGDRVSSVGFRPDEEQGGQLIPGEFYYTKSDGTEVVIVDLNQLRDYLLTPSEDTPDIHDNPQLLDDDLNIIVTDSNGEAVKMTLEDLRQRFIASSDNDNANFEDAQIGEFIYEEITEIEVPAT